MAKSKGELYKTWRGRGWTYQQIAEKFCVTRQAVWYTLRYHGDPEYKRTITRKRANAYIKRKIVG